MRLSDRTSNALLLGLGIAVAIGLAAFWPLPVKAQEACRTVSEIVSVVEGQGGTLINMVDLPGDGFDQVLFFENGGGTIIMGLANDGCVVSPPIPVGKAREVTPA